MLINLTISSILLSSILFPSSILQIPTNSNMCAIKNSAFSKVFSPIIRISETNILNSIDLFNSMFIYSKALQVTSKSKCTTTNDLQLKRHKKFDSICINFNQCTFSNCKSYDHGGAVECVSSNVTFAFCLFENCNSKYGGSIYSTRSKKFNLNHSTIVNSHAERFGAIYSDSKRPEFSSNFTSSNISYSFGTIYIAGIRVETTQPNFQYMRFHSTYAPQFGAVWDWSTQPVASFYNYCDFTNVSSGTAGAGITLYHWLQIADITNCNFQQSKQDSIFPCYIYVYSSESIIKIINCKFDLPYNKSIGERYGGNNITVNNNDFPTD